MKFYSEMLDKLFDSAEALRVAEDKEKSAIEKAREAEKKAKAEKELELRKIETLKKDLNKKYEMYLKAKSALVEATKAYCDKYQTPEDDLLDETSKRLYDLFIKMFK